MLRLVTILESERGLRFRDGRFTGLLGPGRHLVAGLGVTVEKTPVRALSLAHAEKDQIARSGLLGDAARVVEVGDNERALVWIDGRFAGILTTGTSVVWTVGRKVEVEIVAAGGVVFTHDRLAGIVANAASAAHLEQVRIEEYQRGILLVNGRRASVLEPGLHVLWKGVAIARVVVSDTRETLLEVAGQELLTADRVSVRLNFTVVFHVEDVVKASGTASDPQAVLYREAQLALRAAVGSRDLDTLLADREEVSREVLGVLRAKAAAYGHAIRSAGVRDIILPGEIRDLLNKVTEARKAAEAALITRREETAAMRSQLNTARLIEGNPTLLRLRELETLERVAANTKLTVLSGEGGLAERIVTLV
jgi:regulator of protease activity HflC (stomatin/prohibitin superfamily)